MSVCLYVCVHVYTHIRTFCFTLKSAVYRPTVQSFSAFERNTPPTRSQYPDSEVPRYQKYPANQVIPKYLKMARGLIPFFMILLLVIAAVLAAPQNRRPGGAVRVNPGEATTRRPGHQSAITNQPRAGDERGRQNQKSVEQYYKGSAPCFGEHECGVKVKW